MPGRRGPPTPEMLAERDKCMARLTPGNIPFTCGICEWGRDGLYHGFGEYEEHMDAEHPLDNEAEVPSGGPD